MPLPTCVTQLTIPNLVAVGQTVWAYVVRTCRMVPKMGDAVAPPAWNGEWLITYRNTLVSQCVTIYQFFVALDQTVRALLGGPEIFFGRLGPALLECRAYLTPRIMLLRHLVFHF